MRSLNCLLVQDAHSVPCERILSVAEVSSENVSVLTAKEMLFADFLDMHLDLIFSELFTHIQGETIAT